MKRALYPKKMYPDGHDGLARSLGVLGLLHEDAEEYGKAESLLQEALAMYRALYPKARFPNGHLDLSKAIMNVGLLYWQVGDYRKAELLYRESLDMDRALFPKAKFPDGHSGLAKGLYNVGALDLTAGRYGKAEANFRESLAMSLALLRRHADGAAEAEALNFAATQAPTRDALLSVTRDPPNAAVYDDLWGSRAVLTRLQEQRHRQLAASRDPSLSDIADQLRLARLNLSRRLLRPLADADANRADIARLTDAKEELEKRLASKMKLPPLPKAEVPAPRQLAGLLPAGTCFIDM
jgi:tetratricopeptide (TPR) repeat protein